MLSQENIVFFLFLLGLICLTFTIVGFYSNYINSYKHNSEKTLEIKKNECDSCYASIMQ